VESAVKVSQGLVMSDGAGKGRIVLMNNKIDQIEQE